MRLPPWHAHPDVWLLVIVLEGAYLWAVSRWRPEPMPGSEHDEPAVTRRQITWYTLGVVAVWAASDWPIHDIAERYLFSVHMFQHMLISLVAPALLLLGMPSWLLRRVIAPRPINWAVRTLARPFFALVIFNAVIVFTHWPVVVDGVLGHHSLHFLSHALLFGAAVLMWWPVVSPLPEMPTLSYPGRMVYLFLQSIVPTVPASFLTFGSSPLYHFYEHVPRLWSVSVMTDQQIAGLIMKLGGGAILWSVLAVVFFKWFALEQKGWDALAWHGVERELRARFGRPEDRKRSEELSQR
jgi:putative membrane protein